MGRAAVEPARGLGGHPDPNSFPSRHLRNYDPAPAVSTRKAPTWTHATAKMTALQTSLPPCGFLRRGGFSALGGGLREEPEGPIIGPSVVLLANPREPITRSVVCTATRAHPFSAFPFQESTRQHCWPILAFPNLCWDCIFDNWKPILTTFLQSAVYFNEGVQGVLASNGWGRFGGNEDYNPECGVASGVHPWRANHIDDGIPRQDQGRHIPHKGIDRRHFHWWMIAYFCFCVFHNRPRWVIAPAWRAIMTNDELTALEQRLDDLLREKKRVGEFDANAGAIIQLTEALRDVVRHLGTATQTLDVQAAMEHVRKLQARGQK